MVLVLSQLLFLFIFFVANSSFVHFIRCNLLDTLDEIVTVHLYVYQDNMFHDGEKPTYRFFRGQRSESPSLEPL